LSKILGIVELSRWDKLSPKFVLLWESITTVRITRIISRGVLK
jgi:hypothetical protein